MCQLGNKMLTILIGIVRERTPPGILLPLFSSIMSSFRHTPSNLGCYSFINLYFALLRLSQMTSLLHFTSVENQMDNFVLLLLTFTLDFQETYIQGNAL